MTRPIINGLDDIAAIERRPYGEVVPVRSTYELIQHAAAAFGPRPALTLLPTGHPDDVPRTLTYRDLAGQVARAAAGFEVLGVGPDDAVGLLLPTLPETFVALFAAERAGRACPVNYMLGAEHVARILEEARTKVLVVFGPDEALAVWPKLPEIRRLAPGLRHVVVVPSPLSPAPLPADAMTFAALLDLAPASRLSAREIGPDTVASYFHTGGSTGAPKLLTHTHGNEVHASWFMGCYFGFGADDAVFNGFPLFHVAGAFCYGAGCFAAGTHVVIPSHLGMRSKPFVAHYWRLVEKHRVSLLNAGPTFLTTLLNAPDMRFDRDRVRAIISGGSSLPAELARHAEESAGLPVRSVYGMTETCGLVSVEPLGAPRVPDSVGLRLPYSELCIAAPLAEGRADTARPRVPGETGVIAVRGPHVSPGYSDARRSTEAFAADGWLLTGDLGYMDQDGRLFITGRAKDVIIRGGHNIDPAGIEDALMLHPDVQLCAAIGQPDPYAGEVPVAFVMLRPGSTATLDAVLAHARPHIPEPAAVPRRLFALDAFPMTSTGKILRPALRRQVAACVVEEALAPLCRPPVAAQVRCVEMPARDVVQVTLSGPVGDDLLAQVREAASAFRLPLEVTVAP